MIGNNIFYVYVGDHPLTGEPCYFGKGQRQRIARHITNLKKGIHENPHLQAIQNKYGPIVWSKVRVDISEQEALSTEIALIAYFGRVNSGTGILTNRTDGGDGVSGSIWTEESREKMKKPKTEAHRQALRIANLGKKASAETRAQMRAAKVGKIRTPQHCENLSSSLKGRMPAPVTMEKALLANKGRVQTPEEIETRRIKNTGQKRSKEFGLASSIRQRGRVFSPETIERMRLGQQRRFSRTDSIGT